MARSLKTLSKSLEEIANSLEAIRAGGEEISKLLKDQLSKIGSEEIEITPEAYEAIALVIYKYKMFLGTMPEPLKSLSESSYYIGFLAGLVKSKGVIK